MSIEARETGTSGTAGWQVQTLGGDAVLCLTGEIDMAAVAGTSPGLLHKLLEAVDGAARVTCELREVGFMDSSGIHLLVNLRDRLAVAGRPFQLVRPGDSLQRLFEIVNANDLFQFVEVVS